MKRNNIAEVFSDISNEWHEDVEFINKKVN